MSTEPERTLLVEIADWPVVAALADGAVHHELGLQHTPDQPLDHLPIAVLQANRVQAASPAARHNGVRRAMRKREAESRCTGLVVLPHDEVRDARYFEYVLSQLATLTPSLEVLRPGRVAFSVRGPVRRVGGEQALVASVRQLLGEFASTPVFVGIAEGTFAARQAAYQNHIVPVGGTPQFLAPLRSAVLPSPRLVDVFERLGLRTLGDIAVLPLADMVARFGAEGARLHALASGTKQRVPVARRPPPEWSVAQTFDPPIEQVDAIAFAVRSTAEAFVAALSERGLACRAVSIELETEHAEHVLRTWSSDTAFDANALIERVRWQLDGWVSGVVDSTSERPTSGVCSLRLAPAEVEDDGTRQLGFWGGLTAADERAMRAIARVQAMVGHEAVRRACVVGGRGPLDRVQTVPWGEPLPKKLLLDAPWVGGLPDPLPIHVPLIPQGVVLRGESGDKVRVSSRGWLSEPPHLLVVGSAAPDPVVGWSGPWCADEHWWDKRSHRRHSRVQLVVRSGAALLLRTNGDEWLLEARYD